MFETIDIDRCIWDVDYRRQVKRMLNGGPRSVLSAANENTPETLERKAPEGATKH